MPSRSRQESRGHVFGYKAKGDGTFLSSKLSPASTIQTYDVTKGNGDGYDFDAYAYYQTGGLINDTRSNSELGRRFIDWRCDGITGLPSSFHTIGNHTSSPSDSALAAKLVAMTNPSRPIVDLPTFIYEMKEIPDLLRKEGGNWIRKLGSVNLKYHFGVKPMVNDLIKMVTFQSSVDQRVKELQDLHRSGLRRKRNLWSNSFVSTGNGAFFNSLDKLVSGDINRSHFCQKWGFVEWFPEDPRLYTSAETLALAKKAVFGLTVDFSTAWNIMPWSWLIDWFGSVGDYLEGKRNIVGATHGPVLIMSHRRTVGQCKFDKGFFTSDWTYTATHKSRRKASPSPFTATLPFLTGRQFSILGSIGVTRRMPRNL